VTDAGAARVIERLVAQRSRRLFTVDGAPVSSDVINARLAQLSGAHLTAKDFRTWIGTKTAFSQLRAQLPAGEDAETQVIAALDLAASALGNTRTVARSHYVHPDVVDGYTSGELARFLGTYSPPPAQWLDEDEALLLGYLTDCLEQRAGDLAAP
jgi:DNA topoisomerase-1